MASLDSIQTTAQNVAQNVNNVSQTYLQVQGLKNSVSLSTPTLVQRGQGRICRMSVTTAGSAGFIYDSVDITATTNPLAVIPATTGIYEVNFPVSFGIVVAPGAGQKVMVSFSQPAQQ